MLVFVGCLYCLVHGLIWVFDRPSQSYEQLHQERIEYEARQRIRKENQVIEKAFDEMRIEEEMRKQRGR